MNVNLQITNLQILSEAKLPVCTRISKQKNNWSSLIFSSISLNFVDPFVDDVDHRFMRPTSSCYEKATKMKLCFV